MPNEGNQILEFLKGRVSLESKNRITEFLKRQMKSYYKQMINEMAKIMRLKINPKR